MQDRLNRLSGYLAYDPSNAQLLADVADAQLQVGEWTAAKASLQRLLALQPGDALASYRMGVAERSSGNAPAALPWLQAALDASPGQSAVLAELARTQAQLGDWPAALQSLAGLELASLPTSDGDAVWSLRVRAAHHAGDVNAALRDAQAWKAARGVHFSVRGHAALATLLLDAERVDDAAQELSELDAQAITNDAELSAAAGFVALSQGRADAALEHFNRGVTLDQHLGRAHLGSGLALAYQGDIAGATQRLKDAVSVTPGHLGSWHALAWMRLLAEDLDGASATFEAALKLDANFGESHGGLALVAALRGNRDAAQQHLQRAARLDARSVNVMVTRTVLEQPLGAATVEVMKLALSRFLGSAAERSPELQIMLTRLRMG